MVDSTCRVVGIHRHVNMKCTALFLLFLTVTLAYQDNDDTENLEYGELYDGDIMMNNDDDMNGEVGPLNAIVDPEKIWPNGVLFYEIDPNANFTPEQIADIENGILDLVNSSRVNGELCIDVQLRDSETNYVRVGKYGGCSSYLGMRGGMQTLSLEDSCVSRHGTIMHEFIHAFGFHHEQKRSDRDDYVTINWSNIEVGYWSNFDKLENNTEINLLGTPYDYGSCMHYGEDAFAINDSIPTIITHDPDAEIGQRTHLSALDVERVQLYHNCLSPVASKFFKHLIL